MILKQLEMQGFKSFPDKTTLRFGRGITSVVGPNGSGKSNISDAVRWVLGEQSSKTLRGSRMEDVIFSGTDERRAVGFAEVTLVLDNTDRRLDIDKDEISVTRRYYRSGESEYSLNGTVVRLRDINELFMDTGLGRDGYSLIGQGRIADLVSAKSPQRREILEEAAGIAHFRYRRTDANRKLEQAEENLIRLRDILAELESRVGPLKVQSEKAQKFLELAQEKKSLEIGLWLHSMEKARDGLRQQEHRLSLAALQHEQAENDLGELEKEIEDLIAQAREITLKIEQIRMDASGFEEEAVKTEGRIAVEESKIEYNNSTIERITRDMEQAADTQQHLDSQIEQALAEIAQMLEAAGQKQLELDLASRDLEEIRRENSETAKKLEALSAQTMRLEAQLSEKRIAASTAASSKEEIEARIAAVEEAAALKRQELDGLGQERTARSGDVDAGRSRAQEIANAVAGYAMIASSREQKSEKAKKELETLNLDIHQKNARVKMLEDLEKNMEGYFGSVKAVMREAKRGTLKGIHGPVSQLISVPEAYAVAVETALGASIQHIVTDNENDAKKAIYYLKDSREGRATFLPLTAIKARPFTEKGLEKCAGFVNMADRLVSGDKRYEAIVSSLLSYTAVTDNLDNAIEMAKKYANRFRIVTLDGQVINAGGSMTGGSKGQGGGILSRANEIEKLGAQAAALQKEYEAKQSAFKTITEELAAAQAQLSGAQADLANAQEEIIRREGELRMTDEKIRSAREALETLEAEKETSARRIESLSEAIGEADAQVKQLEKEIALLRNETGSLAQERSGLDSRRDEVAAKEAAIKLDILAIRKDMEAKEEAAAALRRRKASHEERLGSFNEEISAIANSSIETKALIEQLKIRAGELRAQSAAAGETVAALIAERNALEAKSTALRGEERNKTRDKELLGGELARLGERKAALEKELEDARNKLFDEYQLSVRQAEEMGIVIEEPAKAQRTLNEIRNKIRNLGSVNVGAIEEYKEVSERYEFMSTQINDIEKSREELMILIEDLTGKMSVRFREQFNAINKCFGEIFTELFEGGKAELVLENPHDVLECNIEIKVQPPGKNVHNIDLLSGGEKGFSAIALLFAILKINPAPFCIFDEVEAALDDVNVTKFAEYVRSMTAETQFILITHRRGTMEEADSLYGVTMQEKGVSKLLELQTTEIAKQLGIV